MRANPPLSITCLDAAYLKQLRERLEAVEALQKEARSRAA